MPTREGTLKAREFLFFTEDLAIAALPPGFDVPTRKVMWTILQLFYADPLVHFELQPQPSRGLVELGLHFEGDAEANEAAALALAQHTHEIRAALGPEWELEEWTASWRRLHRTYTFTKLTAALGREIAEEMTKAMVALAPLIHDVRVRPPERAGKAKAPSAASSSKWRQRGRKSPAG